jgi:hypothetical protein
MFNIDRYINKSIVNQFPNFVNNLNEAKSQKAFFDQIFSMADELADVVNARDAVVQRTQRQSAAIRGYAERARTKAAQARAKAADRIAAAREASSSANIAAIGVKAETEKKRADIDATDQREKSRRADELNDARVEDLRAKAALNTAKATSFTSSSDPANSDERASVQAASAAASGNAVPPAKNAAETLKNTLINNTSSESQIALELGRGYVLPQPKKGTPSIELEPESTSTTSKPAAAKKRKLKPSVKAKTKAADKPAPTPAPVKKEEPKKNTNSGRTPNKASGNKGRTKKDSAPVKEGLTPEQLAIAAQIRRENDLKKRGENPPDERY